MIQIEHAGAGFQFFGSALFKPRFQLGGNSFSIFEHECFRVHGPKPISFRTDQLPLEATYIWSPSLSIYMQYRQVYDLCCICLGRSLGYGFDTTIICLRQGWPCITTVRISQAKQFSMNGMSKTFVLDGWSDRGEACVNHINLLLFCIQLAPCVPISMATSTNSQKSFDSTPAFLEGKEFVAEILGLLGRT